MSTQPPKDPITCHVLNTLNGLPASNLPCKLTLLSALPTTTTSTQEITPTRPTFTALTNNDGRVQNWTSSLAASSDEASATVAGILSSFPDGSKTAWSIEFGVGEWYGRSGIECFWPEVEVKVFVVKGERHYHVPLLLGPWSYSTYRGS